LLANDGTEVIDFLYFVKQSLAVTFCQTKSQPLLSRPQNKKPLETPKKCANSFVCSNLIKG